MYLSFLAAASMPTSAPASAPAVSESLPVVAPGVQLPGDPAQLIEFMREAWESGYWPLAAAAAIMVVVYVLRVVVQRFGFALPKTWLPWIASATALLTGFALDLAGVDGQPLWSVISKWLLVGLAAAGVWSAGAKKLFPEKEKPKGNCEPKKPVDTDDDEGHSSR
jgi:hypothetical protein